MLQHFEQKPKAIDNLEKVSFELLNYIITHRDHMVTVVSDVNEQYTAPLQSWIFGYFYSFYRTRVNDIQSTQAELEKIFQKEALLGHSHGNKELLELIAKFFKKGNWQSTSANTNFMRSLLAQLTDYDENSPLTDTEIKRLNEILLKQIPIYLIVEEQKQKIEQELQLIQSLKNITTKPEVLHLKSYSPPVRRRIADNPELNVARERVGNFYERTQNKSYAAPDRKKLNLADGQFGNIVGKLNTLFFKPKQCMAANERMSNESFQSAKAVLEMKLGSKK